MTGKEKPLNPSTIEIVRLLKKGHSPADIAAMGYPLSSAYRHKKKIDTMASQPASPEQQTVGESTNSDEMVGDLYDAVNELEASTRAELARLKAENITLASRLDELATFVCQLAHKTECRHFRSPERTSTAVDRLALQSLDLMTNGRLPGWLAEKIGMST